MFARHSKLIQVFILVWTIQIQPRVVVELVVFRDDMIVDETCDRLLDSDGYCVLEHLFFEFPLLLFALIKEKDINIHKIYLVSTNK
jgi:hypothetical protein